MSKPPRFRRVLRRSIYGLVFLLLAGAGGLWWAHQHLAKLIVASFNRTYPDLELSVKAVALTGFGELNLKSVRVRVRRDGSEVLKVPAAKMRFSWHELRTHFIREIFIERPAIKATDALLTALPASAQTSGKGVPWRIGHLAITDGSARIAIGAWPEARFRFRIEQSAAAGGANVVEVTSLSVRTRPDGTEVLALPALKVRASLEDLAARKIRAVILEKPRITLTEHLRQSLPKLSGGDGAVPEWTVEHLAIEGGQASADLAGLPRVDFGFAAQADGQRGELAVADLRVRLRTGGAEALAIPSVKARVTLDGLRKKKLREILIGEPALAVTDALLAAFPPAAEKPPADNPPDSPTPWKLERLTVRGGRASVDLQGAPLVQLGFGARLGDDLLPPHEPGELQASVDFTDVTVRARGAALEPFLRVPSVRTKFRLPEVQREQRVAWVQVEGLDFRFNKIFRDLIGSGAKPALPAAEKTVRTQPAQPFTIGELIVKDGGIHLDDLGLDIPSIDCRVNTTFRHLRLAPGAGAGGQELQTIELSRIALTSPLDPFVPVLSLDAVFIRFTLAGIWRREIEEISIIRPRLDIGPDFFWYIDRVQKNAGTAPEAAAPVADAGPDWRIRKFNATAGQLFLALEGHSELALPMPFESNAENLNFRHLSDLRLKLRIDMPEQDYHYPGYELALRGVAGRVEFSLPPAQGANNVVNTLRLREVRWKQFQGRDCHLAVTYDERGIYGTLGGKGYGGVLNGQFNFLLRAGSPWNGWVSGTRIDLKPVTDALAPDKFSLAGPANFHVTVAAHGADFQKVAGDFSATRPGHLRVGKIDDLIRELPGDWTGLKRGLSRISLETLRDFGYDSAHGDFRFHGRAGALHLDLRGPGGSRRVGVDFHAPPPARKGGRLAAQEP